MTRSPKSPALPSIDTDHNGRAVRTPNMTGSGGHCFSAMFSVTHGGRSYRVAVYQLRPDHVKNNGLEAAVYLAGRMLPETHKPEVRQAALDSYAAEFLTEDHKARAWKDLAARRVSALDWEELRLAASGDRLPDFARPELIQTAARERIAAMKAAPVLAETPAAPVAAPAVPDGFRRADISDHDFAAYLFGFGDFRNRPSDRPQSCVVAAGNVNLWFSWTGALVAFAIYDNAKPDRAIYLPETRVSLWKLAPDAEAYGDKAGHFILTSPDGGNELPGGPWESEDSAVFHALKQGWTVVPSLVR